MSAARIILVALLSVGACAVEAGAAGRKVGSKARQLALKQALDKQMEGTLFAELNRNREVWQSLKPDQLRLLRNRYYAFLREDDQRQADLLEAAAELNRLTDEQRRAYREREKWLIEVVRRLTPEQREQLRQLSPQDRARRLLELRDELLGPTPRPTEKAEPDPTTRPVE